ncbi:MAG: hypothetical protein OCD02_12170 [Spirochaetaceae bacterium]
MLLNRGNYHDSTSKTSYKLKDDISLNSDAVYLLQGENGIGKSRFIEGVLLKEFKDRSLKTLYFAQDIENQLLSYKLISLVKEFIGGLKKQKSFFKTIFLNDDAHESIKLDFNQEEVLDPNSGTIYNFILGECKKFNDADVIIFDEVDKYFVSSKDFTDFITSIKVKNIFIISHILNNTDKLINNQKNLTLTKDIQGVNIEFLIS